MTGMRWQHLAVALLALAAVLQADAQSAKATAPVDAAKIVAALAPAPAPKPAPAATPAPQKPDPGVLSLDEGWIMGRSTPFGKPNVVSGPAVKGVCGYGDTSQTLFPRLNVASVSAANPGRICGTCIQVRCLQKNCTTTRPFIVQVVDSCGSKGCSPNELQLPVDTYTTSLAPSNFSQVLVQYRVVPCNPVGDIVVHVADVKRQTGGQLMTLAFISVAGSDKYITGIRLQSGGGRLQPVGRVAGNTGLWRGLVTGSAPFSVQIEDTNNQVYDMPDVITRARVGNYLSEVQLRGYDTNSDVAGEAPLPRQDDLLAALTGDRASELDRKLAATPIIQKLLLADDVNEAAITRLQLNGTDVAMTTDNAFVLQQITYEMLGDVTSAPVSITRPLAGFGASASGARRMLRQAKDTSVTVGVVVETPSAEERAAVLATLRSTINSGIFPSRLNSAGLGVNFMTVDFVRPNAPTVVSPASAGVSASPSRAQAPIEDASIDTGGDDGFPIGAIIGTAVGGGLLLLAAIIIVVCCARRQRQAATARKLNAACDGASEADWQPNAAFDKPVYENQAFEKAETGGGFGAKLGGVFGINKLDKSAVNDGDSKDARGMSTIDLHAESQQDERSLAPAGAVGRSPSPGASPLRWQDVRASGGQQPAYDTPSPNTAQPPSPWTGMLDSLRRSPPKAAPSPGSDPSARYRPVAETQLAPVPEPMPTAAGGDAHHAAGAVAAGAAAAVVGAVAAGTLAAKYHDRTDKDVAAGSADAVVEQSAPSATSMGSQPSHLPDEAFCTGDAVPEQSPQPLLTKSAEKAAKAPKTKAQRSLWGGLFGSRRRAASPAADPGVPLEAMTEVHVPSEAGSPGPRQAALVVTNIDSPVVPPADASPFSERDHASPSSERDNPQLLESPVAAAPSPGAALMVAPLAAGLQEDDHQAQEGPGFRKLGAATGVKAVDPELPAGSREAAAVWVPPVPVSKKPPPEQLVISDLKMAGDSHFVMAADATVVANAAPVQPAQQAVVLNVAEPMPQPESSKMAKPSGLAALKGFLRSPLPADDAADQRSPEPQVVLPLTSASTQPRQADAFKPDRGSRAPQPVRLSISHQRSASQLSEEGSPSKSLTPHEPRFTTFDDRDMTQAAPPSPATRRVRIQEGDGTIVESPRVAGRHVRVPRAGALDDSLCHSPAGSASPNRQAGGSRSGRGTPDSSSRVPRPYAAGRNDVMPFTAEELMIFKEAQATGRVAGSVGGESRRSRGSEASRVSTYSRAASTGSQRPRRDHAGSYAPSADNLRRVAAIPEGVREVLGLPGVPGGPLPGVPRPASARRGQRSLFEEALSETGSAGSRKHGSSDGGRSRSSQTKPQSSPSQKHFK